MASTNLLPPMTAIRMVWAQTGKFSNDEQSRETATLVDASLKDIIDQAEGDEKKYITSAVATMNACLRSLDIVYKGRELNFQENEKLRLAYLESIKESLTFGEKAKDFMQSIPTMTISAAGGLTIGQLMGVPPITLTGIALVLAAAGYLFNRLLVKRARRKSQLLYIAQDYERSLYYNHYVSRVSSILTSLYLDLDRIHKNIFQTSYPIDGIELSKMIKELLDGVRPSFCPYIHKHVLEKKITPEIWATCETGGKEAIKYCPLWNYETGVDKLKAVVEKRV